MHISIIFIFDAAVVAAMINKNIKKMGISYPPYGFLTNFFSQLRASVCVRVNYALFVPVCVVSLVFALCTRVRQCHLWSLFVPVCVSYRLFFVFVNECITKGMGQPQLHFVTL